MAKEKSETASITFKCPPEVKRAANILAAHDDLSLSEFIVKILVEVIEDNGKILGNADLRPKSLSRRSATTKAKSPRKKKPATKADDSATATTEDSTDEHDQGGDGL